MKKVCFSALLCICLSGMVFANSAPSVTQIGISPLSGGVFEISYRLIDADNDQCSISVQVSSDGGSTYSITPSSSSLSGDLTNVYPGYRSITWDSTVDLPGVYKSNYRVKVTADDGQGTAGPSLMVWVYINDPGVSGHESFTGYMSKYETTNAQYCQYLNSAKASNDITVSGSYVVGTSGPYSGQNYYYLAGSGFTYNGATNGGSARINWTGSSFTVDSGFENHPVTYVSWYGSTAFASYYGWRLPTEWEWQAVADYNGSYTYGCGTTINNSKANYYNSVHPHGTTVVGAFGSYGYGMCDMAGNVWEWTSSLYDPAYSCRIIRGGSWFSYVTYCAVSFRGIDPPGYTYGSYGFRVCR